MTSKTINWVNGEQIPDAAACVSLPWKRHESISSLNCYGETGLSCFSMSLTNLSTTNMRWHKVNFKADYNRFKFKGFKRWLQINDELKDFKRHFYSIF